MASKILGYTREEVLRLVFADASIRTGVPVEQLEGGLGDSGARVLRKDGTDLLLRPEYDQPYSQPISERK